VLHCGREREKEAIEEKENENNKKYIYLMVIERLIEQYIHSK
jgi:hypothetical protein